MTTLRSGSNVIFKYCALKKNFICFDNPVLLDCGCTPGDVAAANIHNVEKGAPLAVCELESTSEGGKGAIWTLVCDDNNNGRQDNHEYTIPRLEMPDNTCKLEADLSCNTDIPFTVRMISCLQTNKHIFRSVKTKSATARNTLKTLLRSVVPAMTCMFAAVLTVTCTEFSLIQIIALMSSTMLESVSRRDNHFLLDKMTKKKKLLKKHQLLIQELNQLQR